MMDSMSSVSEVCNRVFDTSSHYANYFVAALLFIRIGYANVTGSAQSETTDAIKGAVTYYILIIAFPYILDIIFLIPETFLPSFDMAAAVKDVPVDDNGPSLLSAIPLGFRVVLESLTTVIYYIGASIHVLFMIVMCAIAPIIILFATMLGLGVGVRIFFGLMILASCWPIMWAALSEFNNWCASMGGNAISMMVTELVTQSLKAIGPLWLSAMAVKSGPGKALTSAATAALPGSSLVSSIKESFGKDSASIRNHTPGGPLSDSAPSRNLGSSGSSGSSAPPSSQNGMGSASISPTSRPAGATSSSDRTLSSQQQGSYSVPSSSPAASSTSRPMQNGNDPTAGLSDKEKAPKASDEQKAIQDPQARDMNSQQTSRPIGSDASDSGSHIASTQTGSSSSSSTTATASGSGPSASPVSHSTSTVQTSSSPANSAQSSNPAAPAPQAPVANASASRIQSSGSSGSDSTPAAAPVSTSRPTASTQASSRPKRSDPQDDIAQAAMTQMLNSERKKRG